MVTCYLPSAAASFFGRKQRTLDMASSIWRLMLLGLSLAVGVLAPSSRFLAWRAFKPWPARGLALADGLVGDLEGLQDLGFADSAAENAIPRLGDLALERGLIHGAEQARLMGEILVEALAGERGFVVNPRSQAASLVGPPSCRAIRYLRAPGLNRFLVDIFERAAELCRRARATPYVQ